MTSVKTILLVENDQVSQTMYQRRLEREGYHLECAPDGQVALDILSERAPDLVLLDLMLPKVSGADVLRFMQADPRLTTVPVIIFSNAPLTEVPPDSPLAQGTKRLLKSDCTFPKLLETIEDSLAKAPELVVVEANKKPSARPVAASNGQPEIKNDRFDLIPPPDFGSGIPKPLADFLAEAPTIMPKLREHSMGYIKAPDSETGQTHLSGLLQRVQLLHTSAAQAGCARVGMLMSALDSLLSGIKDKPSTVTPPMLQTIAQAVDCLDGLLKAKDGYSAGPAIHAKVLVVDDDTVCNHVNVTSLKRANFEADSVKDPAEALTLLETTPYDLVVLDVNMPGMTGFDVCEKMRRLPHNKKTPVIFVTAFSSFDNRKQSVLSGGNDFVSKPVSPVELALKVAINLIKARVQGSGDPQSAPIPAAINGSSHTPQPPAKTKDDQQPAAETPQPEPPSRLAPLPKSGTRNTRTAGPLSETPPETKPNPTGQRNKNDPPGADIHERLRQSTAALEHAKAGLEQESAERARIESQWREQLNAAKALIGQTETVLKEKEALCTRLEEELAGLRKAKDELQDKLTTGQQAAAKAQQEVKELQERVRQGTAELERAKTSLQQQSAERTRLESELREQLNKAKTAAGAAEAVLKEKEARCGQLEKEVAGLQQDRKELQNKVTAGQQATEKLQQEIKELQAGLGQQTAEKMRLESEWREKFNAAAAATARTETALKEKDTQNAQLEKDLAGLRQSRDELQNKFAAEQQATTKFRQEIKDLNERLQQGAADLERTRTNLEQESAKRTHLESEHQKLMAAQEALNRELGGLRESQAAREAEMRDKQKKLAEGLRENIQLLQSKLQEAEAISGDLHNPPKARK